MITRARASILMRITGPPGSPSRHGAAPYGLPVATTHRVALLGPYPLQDRTPDAPPRQRSADRIGGI